MDRAPDKPPSGGLGDPPKPAVVGSNPTGPASTNFISIFTSPKFLNSGVIIARGLSNFMKPALGPKGVNKLLITELKDIMLEIMSFSHPIAWLLQDERKALKKFLN